MRHQKLLINSQLKDRVIEGPERGARASACPLEGAKLDPAVQTGQ
jgi:hypothetical protein